MDTLKVSNKRLLATFSFNIRAHAKILNVNATLDAVKSNVTGHHAGKKGTDRNESAASVNAIRAVS